MDAQHEAIRDSHRVQGSSRTVRIIGTVATVGALLAWLFLLYVTWVVLAECPAIHLQNESLPACAFNRSNVYPIVAGISLLLAGAYLFGIWKIKNEKGLIAGNAVAIAAFLILLVPVLVLLS